MSYAPVKGELSNSLPVQISTAEVLCWQSGNILAFSRKRAFRDTHTEREQCSVLTVAGSWPLGSPSPQPHFYEVHWANGISSLWPCGWLGSLCHGDMSVAMSGRKHCVVHRRPLSALSPSPIAHPLFYEVQTRTLGLTGEGTDSCFLYGEWTHSCSKARTFSNEMFFFPGNESSYPEIIKSWECIALRKPLNFMAHTSVSMQDFTGPE